MRERTRTIICATQEEYDSFFRPLTEEDKRRILKGVREVQRRVKRISQREALRLLKKRS